MGLKTEYGKIQNGKLIKAPTKIDGHFNPPVSLLLDHGWLPIKETPKIKNASVSYEVQEHCILQVWTARAKKSKLTPKERDELIDKMLVDFGYMIDE